ECTARWACAPRAAPDPLVGRADPSTVGRYEAAPSGASPPPPLPASRPDELVREGSRSAMGTDATPPRTPPPEQRLADRLAARPKPAPMPARPTAVTM